jgi:hypothetical protein
VHVSPSGSVQSIVIPRGTLQAGSLVAGQEGSAWGLDCDIELGSGESDSTETCEAIKIELGGQVTSYPLPSFNRTFPTADLSSESFTSPPGLSLAVADGVWMNKPAVTTEGSRVWEAAFVSYSGQVTPVEVPTDARLIAPGATADSAWWEEPADGAGQAAPTVTLGQVTPGGALTTVLTHSQEAGVPEAFATIDAGFGGDLLWAESTLSSTAQAGYMGTITPQSETRYAVGEYATAVAPPTPLGVETWSLSPFSARGLYQAANGDIWVISGSEPGRLSVLTPTGGFSTFLPLASGAEPSQIWDVQQSSTGALWFSLDTPNVSSSSASGVLARANPLSPPPGEPPFPGFGATTVSTANTISPAHSELPLAPVLGQSQTVRAIGGTVRVRVKGTRRFAPLLSATTIPDGSEVDATHGRIELTVATPTAGQMQSAEVSGGQFLIHQDRTGMGETHLTLSLPLSGCARAGRLLRPRNAHATRGSDASTHGAKARHIWVSEHGGSWGSSGRYVSTTVEGTSWLTLDECRRSEVEVREGRVEVHDLIHNRSKLVTAGHRYIASRN